MVSTMFATFSKLSAAFSRTSTISFSFIGGAYLASLLGADSTAQHRHAVAAVAYPLGFMFVVLARNQLMEIARRQEAKPLELRAVMSLTRLWYQQGKKKAARQKLAEIYNWFTEGLDTKDLQEAKALLVELA